MFKRLTNRLAAATLTAAVLLAPAALGSGASGLSGLRQSAGASTSSKRHRRARKTHHAAKKTKRRSAHKRHKKAKRHRKAHRKALANPPRILKFFTPAPGALGGQASSPPVSGPLAPADTVPPAVSGSTKQGQTLKASPGEWSENPTSYDYQWQDCDPSGANCTAIASAGDSAHQLSANDVGHTIRVAVTARNATGSAAAISPATAPISASSTTPPSEEADCIEDPHVCGYPDQTNTGVPSGTTLTPRSGDIAVTNPGTTIEDAQVNGAINVQADNTTIKDCEIIAGGGEGEHGIWIEEGVTGTVIEGDTIHGSEPSGNGVVQYAIFSNDESTRIERDYIYNATEPVSGPSHISNSLIEANGTIPEEHYEDVYYGGGGGALIVNHNTLLNPHSQTAVIFASVDFGNQTMVSIINNLMAGGGYMIYGGASGDEGSVLGPVTVIGNRFSRHYFPEGGQYGVGAYFNESVTEWLGNFWDETLKTVPPPGD